MLIAFFINDLEREHAGYTTTLLAHCAAMRGHRVCYLTPPDFVVRPDEIQTAHVRFCPSASTRTRKTFSKR